jgi:hypothetical protein
VSVTYQGLPWLQPLLRRSGFRYYDRITAVHLTGGSYADNVIPHLTRFPHLQTLSLTQTEISPDGLATLRERLRQCEIEVH